MMADRRRRSPEISSKRRSEYDRSDYNEPPRMRSGADYLSSSSSSSSYIDISRTFPSRSGLRTFFTAPSERRRLRKRRSSRLLKLNNSSSSSINSDLAYGTGFIKRPKSRGIRSRKGKEIDRERHREYYRERETAPAAREKDRSGLGRATTDAEILAVGAGLAKLARDQNKSDLKGSKNGYRPGTVRGLGSSKVSHGSDTNDEDGWESASDAESESSVDSKLAFGEDSKGGWFGWGGPRHKAQSRKSSVVDPRLFGPANSLNGVVTEPVGFGDVTWSSSSDFGQRGWATPAPAQSVATGSQSSLQYVYPIPTSDPSRFEAARSSVVSGAEPYISSRPAPIPLQQPQPIAPVSQSVYEPSYSTRAESGISKSSSGRSKSLAEAALAGVAGAAIGAAIAPDRKDDRKERRRDDRDPRDDDRSSRRDDRRKERRDSFERDERKERRRDKERQKDPVDDLRREKRREKRRDEGRDEGRDERREKRREERRSERSDDRYDTRRTKSEAAISTTSIDPFQFQVPDDAFDTPISATPVLDRRRIATVPTVVTVEREPDFTRKRSSSIKDQPVVSRSDFRREDSELDEKQQRSRTRGSGDKALHEAEHIYDESRHFTAPIEITAIEAAVGAVTAEDYRESRSERRREERRGERHDRNVSDTSSRSKRSRELQEGSERDPIQDEADRAYREIVMARKIASQVIRSRTPSPDRSVVDKYDKQEEEVIRIVTPPGMEDHKKEGPYDAPNADFKLDLIIEHPRDLQNFNVPISANGSSRGLPNLKHDPDASSRGLPNLKHDPDALEPRPILNLVRPTPTPSPMPEKQAARTESSKPSKTDSQAASDSTSDVIIDNKGNVVSSPISKGVTWGENETKHYEVETPQDHRDEFVSTSEIQDREKPVDRRVESSAQGPVETHKSSNSSKRAGWGAIAAGIMGAGVGAAAQSSGDVSKTSKTKENERPREAKQPEDSYEYRGVVVEPESPPRRRSPPSTGPKPIETQTSKVPGAFDDDLDFTATVAAGLQDTGFDPDIVINDPSFRRRDSPPGSNEPGSYRAPFAETVSDLGYIPGTTSDSQDVPRGFVMGEVAETPKDWRSVSPDNDDFTTKSGKKDQKRREKARREQSGDAAPAEEDSMSRRVNAEPESYFEMLPKLSKKEQKKRDRAAQKQSSQSEDVTPSAELPMAKEIVEEPESYYENPKKSKKKSKRSSSAFDDGIDDSPRDDRKVSVPIDAFDDLRKGEDEWSSTKKTKKKSKRDSDRFDSPSRAAPSEFASEPEKSSSKKSKDKSRGKNDQYEPEPDPREVSLPPSTPSETSRDGDEEIRNLAKSKKDGTERDDSRSAVSADTSRYDDEYRKSKKKSRSSTRDDNDDTRSVASAPAGDDYDGAKKTKKKDKRNSGSFFGLFGSKSDSGAREESPKGSKDDFDEIKKKSKKSKRSSIPDGPGLYGDVGSQSVSDLAQISSNGNGQSNGSHHYDEGANGGSRSDDDRKSTQARAESAYLKRDSFLAKAGTLGAGVGIAGAVAIAAQHQQSKAAQAAMSEHSEEIPLDDSGALQQKQEILDPEIAQRQFRPSIDPQYGDLLPLPPSDPASPNVQSIEGLPDLPDSRPDTPESERLSREKAPSSTRKSLQETPTKSPSQSAVPLKFIMGNRSIPSSPGLGRSSPLQSPVPSREDSLGFYRTSRPRPTSWDSSREYKPLYLVESNRRGSSAQSRELEETLPSLPPSQSTSRSSSLLDFHDAVEFDEAEQSHSSIRPTVPGSLSIDTDVVTAGAEHGLLDSQQSTPKADVRLRDLEASIAPLPKEKPTDLSSLPPLPRSRSLSPDPAIQEQLHEREDSETKPLAEAALVSSIGYFASTPSHRTTNASWLNELPSRSSTQRQPSPVDPTTKDRSSYLLQSSPVSKELEVDEQVDHAPDSLVSLHMSAFSDAAPFHDMQERDGNDVSGTYIQKRSEGAEVTVAPLPTDVHDMTAALESSKLSSDRKVAEPHLPVNLDDVIAVSKPSRVSADPQATVSSSLADIADVIAAPESKESLTETQAGRHILSGEELDLSLDQGNDRDDKALQVAEEEPVVKSRKERKKDKKKGKGLLQTATDETQLPEASQDVTRETSQSADPEILPDIPSESFKKGKKNEGLSQSSKQGSIFVPDLVQDGIQQNPPIKDVEPIEEFALTRSKKDRKKDKKKGRSPMVWEPEDDTLSELNPEFTPTINEDVPIADTAITDDSWSTETKKSKKKDKKKARSSTAWEPEDEAITNPPPETLPMITGDTPLASTITTSAADDTWSSQSKQGKKKDKKKNKAEGAPKVDNDDYEKSDTSDPFEVSRGIPVGPTLLENPKFTSITTDAPLQTLQDPLDAAGQEIFPKDRLTRLDEATTTVNSDAISQEPAKPLQTTSQIVQETHPMQVIQPSDAPSSHTYAAVTLLDGNGGDHLSKSISEEDPYAIPTTKDSSSGGTKKSKKKKNKAGLYWDPEETEDVVIDPISTVIENTDAFDVSSSKKNKKKGRKSQPRTPEGRSVEDIEESATVTGPSDILDQKSGVIHDKTSTADPKSQSFLPSTKNDSEIPETSQIHISEDMSDPGYAESPVEVTQLLDSDIPATLLSSKDTQGLQPFPENARHETMDETPQREIGDPEENPLNPDPTSVGGPSAQPVTITSPRTSVAIDAASSVSDHYFPSAAGLHSPLTRQTPDESKNRGYFPSATTLLPFASGGTTISGNDHSTKDLGDFESGSSRVIFSESRNIEDPNLSAVDTQPSSFTPDGLKAGYDNNQLSLARQLQEEFGAGSNRSKKYKKKRQSLPSTPDPDKPRSRDIQEAFSDKHPRARSLSIGPSEVAERPESTPMSDPRKHMYSEDQIELARQLKAEFESSNKKTKKDKKKRPGLLSSSSAQDDGFSDSKIGELENISSGGIARSQATDPAESTFKADGLEAGYKEDQLSLARQLQAEFGLGSKKSRKDKTRRSASQTPIRESELRDDYFGQRSHSVDRELSQSDKVAEVSKPDPILKESLRDGLAVGYSEDQLELARQLKDEFGSGSKKSKKEKQRQNLSGGISDDIPTADQVSSDFGGIKADLAQTELDESVLPEGEKGFAVIKNRPKNVKKAKKSDSSATVSDNRGPSQEAPANDEDKQFNADASQIEDVEQGTFHPTTSRPKNELPILNKKLKKGKKGDSLLQSTFDDVASPDHLEAGEVSHDSQEVNIAGLEKKSEDGSFAFEESQPLSRKQSKKDKKKRQSAQAFITEETATRSEGAPDAQPSSSPTQDKIQETGSQKLEPTTADPLSKLNPGSSVAELPEDISVDPSEDTFLDDTFTTKKSKKDKKKGKGSLKAENEDKPSISTPSKPISEDSHPNNLTLLSEPLENKAGNDTSSTITSHDYFGDNVREASQEPNEEWGNFSKKNSKKDKKKRKGSVRAEAEESSGVTTPLESIAEDLNLKDGALLDKEKVATSPFPAIPQDNSVEDAAKEAVKEPDDEWGTFQVKKSKKDKKKRKSGLSTPIEDSPSSFGSSPAPGTAQGSLAQASSTDHEYLDAETVEPLTQAEQPAQDTAAVSHEYSTKLSKKEKKKRKSGITTPVEQSSSFTKSEGVLDVDDTLESKDRVPYPVPHDGLIENNPSQPSQQVDDSVMEPHPEFVTKISKKKEKKQRSRVSTPLEEGLPVEAQNEEDDFRPTSMLEEHPTKTAQDEIDMHDTQDTSQTMIIGVEGKPMTTLDPSTDYQHTNPQPTDGQPLIPERSVEVPTLKEEESPREQLKPTAISETISKASEIGPIGNDGDLSSGTLGRNASKKDNRKRQAMVDSPENDETTSAEKSLTSWADEVEEAGIERSSPVIQDITKKESLAHITSPIETDAADAFVRPSKKGRKGKKKDSRFIDSKSNDNNILPPSEDDSWNIQPREKGFDATTLAATGALAGAALIANVAHRTPSTSEEVHDTTPVKKLSKQEKRKKSIDRRSAPQYGILDDPALWEGEKPRVFEEPPDADDDAGVDEFWLAPSGDHDNITDKQISSFGTSDPTGEKSIHREPADINPPSNSTTTIPDDPELHNTGIKQGLAQPDQFSLSQVREVSSFQPQGGQKPEGQWNDLPDDFVVTSSKKDKKKYKKSRLAEWNTPREQDEPTETIPSTAILPSIPKFPTTSFDEAPQEDTDIHAETASGTEDVVLVPATPFDEGSHHGDKDSDKDISSERSPPVEREPLTNPGTATYNHPGSSSLPLVSEESPIPMKFEHSSRQSPVLVTDDPNRDSAFVAGSPIPRQRGFTDDNESIRDSGVHLRDFSPAPVSATDEAIARLSWPTVNEETETVDLHKSQRQKLYPTNDEHHEEKGITTGHSIRREPEQPEDILDVQTAGEETVRYDLDGDDSHRPLQSDSRDDVGRKDGYRSPDLRQPQRDDKSSPLYRIDKSLADHHDQILAAHSRKPLDSRDLLPSQRIQEANITDLHRTQTLHRTKKAKEGSSVRQRVESIESPDSVLSQQSKEDRYTELKDSHRPKAEKPSSFNDKSAGFGTALAGATTGFAAARQASREQRPGSVGSNRSSSNINRLRTPDPKYRPDSVGSNRSSATPPLRRSDRKSGDLRSLSQQSKPDLAKEAELTATAASIVNTANPTANEGRARAKDMADVYDGFGEGRIGSPRSPTRPHSMRRRQSMQVLDLEQRLAQLVDENRMLAEAKTQAERALRTNQDASSALVERDAEIDGLKRTLDWLQNEVTRLKEVNDGLTSANITLGNQQNDRYGMLESQHAQTTRELQEMRDAHNKFSAGMNGKVKNEVQNAVEDKDREIVQLRAELEIAKEQIREMQRQILVSKANDSNFLTIRDEDYFDTACQQLCQHVQQWVLRFSKFSDMRACRLTKEINNDKIIDRLDNAILDGSDVDSYLADRVKRRDVFMSMTMTMVWEFVFTRYLFGMDREQRQKLKSLEKQLSEVGPAAAVHQWRATTLTLLSKREAFVQQREQDTLAVVNAILETLTEILPPPSHLEEQIQEQLVRVMQAAVDLSIEMRTQRAEYMMLPPLQPEYDANGDLASKVSFNAALMNERSGDTVSNEELEEAGAVVRIVLFPLVVKKGDDSGEGDEEIVVCPAQVLVAKPKKTVRVLTPENMAHQNHSRVSMQSSMPQDYGDSSVI